MKKISILVIASAIALASSAAARSPYISRVLDFVPAPGQFINTLPAIAADEPHDSVCAKVLEQIGLDKNPGMISLGAYGGYVVFGFDHPVVNVEGEYDFKVYGNAFISAQDSRGGSSEPGIIMVAKDTNGNGKADDDWYELKGSEYDLPTTLKNYTITYYKPSENHQAVPDPNDKSIVDKEYIRWTASDGTEGYIPRNRYHAQSYWPEWIEGETLSFTGSRLAPNGEDISGKGTYFVLKMLDWGYVDNQPNEDPQFKGFDIGNAVDAAGNPVKLDEIDFIKVYTAVNQYNGQLGECSTEICGAEDLHPQAVNLNGVGAVYSDPSEQPVYFDLFGRRIENPQPGSIYICRGQKIIF